MNRPIAIPHAQRRAATQAKVIEAAINCLHRLGYSATGIALVAQEAGVSRGAMSQQFPTKADLMIAIVREVFRRETRFYLRASAKLGPEAWIRALPAMMWKLFSKPAGIAVMEIMLASRSDDDLAPRLREIHAAIEAKGKAYLLEKLADAGIAVPADWDVIQHVFVAAVRGLALESMYLKDRKQSEREVRLVEELFLGVLSPTRSATQAAKPEENPFQDPSNRPQAGPPAAISRLRSRNR